MNLTFEILFLSELLPFQMATLCLLQPKYMMMSMKYELLISLMDNLLSFLVYSSTFQIDIISLLDKKNISHIDYLNLVLCFFIYLQFLIDSGLRLQFINRNSYSCSESVLYFIVHVVNLYV